MEQHCGVDPKKIVSSLTQAAQLARQVLKEPEEQVVRIDILNQLYDYCSEVGDLPSAIEALKEIIEVYRPISERTASERKGQPDENLIFYLYSYCTLLAKVSTQGDSVAQRSHMLEAVARFDEYKSLLAQATIVTKKIEQLRDLMAGQEPEIASLKRKLVGAD